MLLFTLLKVLFEQVIYYMLRGHLNFTQHKFHILILIFASFVEDQKVHFVPQKLYDFNLGMLCCDLVSHSFLDETYLLPEFKAFVMEQEYSRLFFSFEKALNNGLFGFFQKQVSWVLTICYHSYKGETGSHLALVYIHESFRSKAQISHSPQGATPKVKHCCVKNSCSMILYFPNILYGAHITLNCHYVNNKTLDSPKSLYLVDIIILDLKSPLTKVIPSIFFRLDLLHRKVIFCSLLFIMLLILRHLHLIYLTVTGIKHFYYTFIITGIIKISEQMYPTDHIWMQVFHLLSHCFIIIFHILTKFQRFLWFWCKIYIFEFKFQDLVFDIFV